MHKRFKILWPFFHSHIQHSKLHFSEEVCLQCLKICRCTTEEKNIEAALTWSSENLWWFIEALISHIEWDRWQCSSTIVLIHHLFLFHSNFVSLKKPVSNRTTKIFFERTLHRDCTDSTFVGIQSRNATIRGSLSCYMLKITSKCTDIFDGFQRIFCRKINFWNAAQQIWRFSQILCLLTPTPGCFTKRSIR